MSHFRSIRVALISAAVVLTLTANASAQTIPPSVQPSPAAPEPMPPEPEAFNVTPFLGLGFAGDFENSPATFGAALGYGLTPRLAGGR